MSEMKECCRWWTAMKSLAQRPKYRLAAMSDWDAAFERLRKSHVDSRRYKGKPERQPTGRTWHEACCKMRSYACSRGHRHHWSSRLAAESGYVNRKRAEVEPEPTMCPECAEQFIKDQSDRLRHPAWIRRLLDHHRGIVRQSKKDAWDRKFSNICDGNSRRAKPITKEAIQPLPATWSEAAKHLVQRHNSWLRYGRMDQWERWASNTASNLRKRERSVGHRWTSNQQQSQEANRDATPSLCT